MNVLRGFVGKSALTDNSLVMSCLLEMMLTKKGIKCETICGYLAARRGLQTCTDRFVPEGTITSHVWSRYKPSGNCTRAMYGGVRQESLRCDVCRPFVPAKTDDGVEYHLCIPLNIKLVDKYEKEAVMHKQVREVMNKGGAIMLVDGVPTSIDVFDKFDKNMAEYNMMKELIETHSTKIYDDFVSDKFTMNDEVYELYEGHLFRIVDITTGYR